MKDDNKNGSSTVDASCQTNGSNSPINSTQKRKPTTISSIVQLTSVGNMSTSQKQGPDYDRARKRNGNQVYIEPKQNTKRST
jgi:hypothetical protein